MRLFGKVSGSYTGARLAHSNKMIHRSHGITLLPQAGVAIGLALSLLKEPVFKNLSPMILNFIIATTLIHELIGPIIAKFVIDKSGESKKVL